MARFYDFSTYYCLLEVCTDSATRFLYMEAHYKNIGTERYSTSYTNLVYFLHKCLIYILPEILQTIRSTWGNFYDHIARYVISGLCNLTASNCSLPLISGEKNCSVIFLSHLVMFQPCCRQPLPVFNIDWTLASRRCSLRSFSYFY